MNIAYLQLTKGQFAGKINPVTAVIESMPIPQPYNAEVYMFVILSSVLFF